MHRHTHTHMFCVVYIGYGSRSLWSIHRSGFCLANTRRSFDPDCPTQHVGILLLDLFFGAEDAFQGFCVEFCMANTKPLSLWLGCLLVKAYFVPLALAATLADRWRNSLDVEETALRAQQSFWRITENLESEMTLDESSWGFLKSIVDLMSGIFEVVDLIIHTLRCLLQLERLLAREVPQQPLVAGRCTKTWSGGGWKL